MGKTLASTVDSSLATYTEDVTKEMTDAYQMTTTFAQAAARKVSKDVTSDAYFEKLTSEYGKIGWNITQADDVKYEKDADEITPKSIVDSLLDSYMEESAQKQLSGLLDAIQEDSAGIHNFSTFWWNSASTDVEKTSIAMGQVSVRNNTASFTSLFYTFNFNSESWRGLFVDHSEAELLVKAKFLRMELNMDIYNTYKSDLTDKLGEKIKEHIDTTELDL